MNSFRKGWYVLYTKPNHERKAALDLSKSNIDHYFPTAQRLRKWHDRNKYVETPLFPSYVFAYISGLKEYFQALEAYGVIHYIRFGKEIAVLDSNTVNYLKKLMEIGNDLEVTVENFTPGQLVHIKEGAMTGVMGEVVEFNDKRKMLVRINLLGRNLLMSLPSHVVIKV